MSLLLATHFVSGPRVVAPIHRVLWASALRGGAQRRHPRSNDHWAEPNANRDTRATWCVPTRRLVAEATLVRVVKADHTDEILDVKTGASDQCSVDITLSHDAASITTLDRAAVKHPSIIGDRRAVQLRHSAADSSAYFLRVIRRRDLAGTDGPHRLVRDNHACRLFGRNPGERAVELGERVGHLLAGLSNRQRLTDAQDRRHAGRQHSLHLRVHERVVLVVVLASLGM